MNRNVKRTFRYITIPYLYINLEVKTKALLTLCCACFSWERMYSVLSHLCSFSWSLSSQACIAHLSQVISLLMASAVSLMEVLLHRWIFYFTVKKKREKTFRKPCVNNKKKQYCTCAKRYLFALFVLLLVSSSYFHQNSLCFCSVHLY